MKKCKCGSYAINPNHHGRDGTDLDLCDVCYWRKRAEDLNVSDGDGCEQCENYDLVKKRLSVECYTCNRYYGDLFLRRK